MYVNGDEYRADRVCGYRGITEYFIFDHKYNLLLWQSNARLVPVNKTAGDLFFTDKC